MRDLTKVVGLIGLAGSIAVAGACSATGRSSVFDDDDDDGTKVDTDGNTGGGGSNEGGSNLGFGGSLGSGGSTSAGGTNCTSQPGDDADMDGWVFPQDCNDCDANVNPAAIEVVGNASSGTGGSGGGSYVPADENCDGMVDNAPAPCDATLALEDSNPMHAAQAIDLCRVASGAHDWGVVSAQYVRANGQPVGSATNQYGIFTNFGPNVTPRGGQRMLGIATGTARIPGQNGACNSNSCAGLGPGQAPSGFPQDVANCQGQSNINDDIALEVQLRAPSNATGYKFNFNFYSFEYPEFVCTAWNDQFIALVNPPPMGSVNGNISFDSQQNPVSVNVAFFDVCQGCPLGTAELMGNGFDTWDDAGATSWLATSAPIAGGELFSIRFAIWDTGDQAWDSTALIDNFEWIANGGTVVVGTEPDMPE